MLLHWFYCQLIEVSNRFINSFKAAYSNYAFVLVIVPIPIAKQNVQVALERDGPPQSIPITKGLSSS
jgi:hypothetical protein